MTRKEILRDIIEDLSRRKRSIEALRLLLEDDDAETALTMSSRLRSDIDGIIARLEQATGEKAEIPPAPAPPSGDAPAPATDRGYLGDADEPTGFERWVEGLIDGCWNAVAHPRRFLRAIAVRRGMIVFVAAIILVAFSGWKAYDRAFLSKQGLMGEYYLDEEFKSLFTKRKDRTINFRWLRRPPMRNFRAEHFSIRWTGYVKTDQWGRHEFYTISDDGVRLWVNDELLIDNWGIHGGVLDKGEITLKPGYHRIVLEYFQGAGDSVIKLQWKRPSDADKENIPARLLFPRMPEG